MTERVRPTRRATPIQAKLTVGTAGDRYEQEADAIADQVVRAMRAPAPASPGAQGQQSRIQPMRGAQADDPREAAIVSRIQRMAGIGAAGGDVDADTEQAIRSSSGGGRPLPAEVRASVEPAFGADFGNVRIHEGARAAELNDRIQAKAFTTGSDIYFRDGLPNMSDHAGRHLLAHELTHTIQQGAVGSGAQRAMSIQRFLDPSQRQQLTNAEGQLKALLQTPKGKGKGAKNRRDKIEALRTKIEELKATDRATPDPSLASGASLTTPSVEQSPAPTTTPPVEVVPEPTPKPTAKQPVVAPKNVAPQPTAPTEQPVVEPEVVPEVVKGPDLATESLRATQAELAAHRLVTPGRRARAKHNKRTAELEAKVIELETEIIKQHPVMSKAIGAAAAQDITNAFEPSQVNELGKTVPAKEMEGLCATIGADKLRTLADAYGIPQMWLRIKTWSALVVKDLLSEYSAAELVALEKAIGIPRFGTLVTARKVPAAAFKHYTNTFMKTFPGADETTWEHLINIKYNYKRAISGGHDQATFYAFVNQEGIDIDQSRMIGANEKVTYTTYWDDGTVAETGSKTLIPGLVGKKATMMADVNDALWNSIAKKEFDVTRSDWLATTRSGAKTFSGFYRNGAIDTFFPV